MCATNRADFTGGSAWETLVRDPKNDPNPATQQRRTHFEAFKDVPVPQTTDSLSKHVKVLCYEPSYYTGYDCCYPSPSNSFTSMQRAPQSDIVTDLNAFTALTYAASGGTGSRDAADGQKDSAFEDFKRVFANTPAVPSNGGTAQARTMLMIDNSMSPNNVRKMIQVAQGLVNAASDTDQMGIALADGTSSLPSPLVATNAAGKAVLTQAPNTYTPVQAPLNLTTAYNAAATTLQGLPSIDGDLSEVTFLSCPGTAVASSLAQTARSKRVPINVITLKNFYVEPSRNLIAATGGPKEDTIRVEDLSAQWRPAMGSGKLQLQQAMMPSCCE